MTSPVSRGPFFLPARNKIEKHDRLTRHRATDLAARLTDSELVALAEENNVDTFREILGKAKLRLAEADAAELRATCREPAAEVRLLDFQGCKTPAEVFSLLEQLGCAGDAAIISNQQAALGRLRELTSGPSPTNPLDAVDPVADAAAPSGESIELAATEDGKTVEPTDSPPTASVIS